MITKHKPWKHQQAAYDFMLSREEQGGAMLAMDPGTGKTKVAVDLIQNHPLKKILIACPKPAIDVWLHEIAKHAVDPESFGIVTPNVGDGRIQQATVVADALFNRSKRRIFIGNYDFLWCEPFRSWALAQSWDLVVADESHRIKSAGGKASRFFDTLRRRAGYSLALTGTPMPHSPLDAYAQMRFVDPTVYGTSVAAFKARYCFLGGFNGRQIIGWQNLDELHEKFYSAAFRVTDDVLDLPIPRDEFRTTQLEAKAARHYRELRKEFITQTQQGVITAKNALSKMLKLQQFAGGWARLDGQEKRYEQISRAKLDLLRDTLEDLPSDAPVVIFCRFHRELDAIGGLLRTLGRTYAELSGRRNDLKRWQAGRRHDLVAQIQAGSESVDFTRSQYTIYYSQGLSLGNYQQSRKRTHRAGQTRNATFFHLLVKGTVDELIYRTFKRNGDIIQTVLRDGP